MDGNQRKNLDDVASSLKQFGVADYSVFVAMLACCSFVGLYFAWDNQRKANQAKNVGREVEDNYLMGGRNMQVFPIGKPSRLISLSLQVKKNVS